MTRRRWLAGLSLAAALAVVGWGMTALSSPSGGTASAAGSEAAGWRTVERGDLVLGVEVTGVLEAVDSAFVSPPALPRMWDFQIAFMAPEGREVRQGEPVLRFATDELEERRLERASARDSSQKEIDKRRTELDARLREIDLQLAEARARRRKTALQLEVPEELAAAAELEKQRIDLALADREIASLEERLRLLERQARVELGTLAQRRDRAAARVAEIDHQIERLAIAAPRSGVVIHAADRRGEKVKVGDTVWRGRQVLEIPDLSEMRARGEIDEADVGRIAPGQPVLLTLDAHPDVEFRGRIERMGRSVGPRTPGDPLKMMEVEIALDSTDRLRMRPGMRFRGRVETERVEDAVLVPIEAVRATPGGPVVVRDGAFGAEEVRPRLGRRNGEHVEVEAGLEPGDRVRVAGEDGR